jgi:hypothetical protein
MLTCRGGGVDGRDGREGHHETRGAADEIPTSGTAGGSRAAGHGAGLCAHDLGLGPRQHHYHTSPRRLLRRLLSIGWGERAIIGTATGAGSVAH